MLKNLSQVRVPYGIGRKKYSAAGVITEVAAKGDLALIHEISPYRVVVPGMPRLDGWYCEDDFVVGLLYEGEK